VVGYQLFSGHAAASIFRLKRRTGLESSPPRKPQILIPLLSTTTTTTTTTTTRLTGLVLLLLCDFFRHYSPYASILVFGYEKNFCEAGRKEKEDTV
jgi:hypothetical protein